MSETWAKITKARAESCVRCGKPLWQPDPCRRKTPEGEPLGYEPVCRRVDGGNECWNTVQCRKRAGGKR